MCARLQPYMRETVTLSTRGCDPTCHACSPRCQVCSPRCHACSPRCHACSPRCHACSPSCHACSLTFSGLAGRHARQARGFRALARCAHGVRMMCAWHVHSVRMECAGVRTDDPAPVNYRRGLRNPSFAAGEWELTAPPHRQSEGEAVGLGPRPAYLLWRAYSLQPWRAAHTHPATSQFQRRLWCSGALSGPPN